MSSSSVMKRCAEHAVTPSTWFRRPPKKTPWPRISRSVPCASSRSLHDRSHLSRTAHPGFRALSSGLVRGCDYFRKSERGHDEEEKHGQREQHEQSAKIQTPAPASPPIVHRLEVSI